jgi:hypothetical protein
MSEDEFTRLFRYMSQRFDAIEHRLDGMVTKDEFNRLVNTVDGLVGRLDTEATERAALTNQVDRHEGWIEQLADKADVKLNYGQ